MNRITFPRFRTGKSLPSTAALALGAASAFLVTVQAQEPSPLELTGAWVRAMPPGRPMTAAYLRIENPSESTVTVTSVTSDRGMASLHESRQVDGQMRMRELPELSIAPGDTAVLGPGGVHIMLMELDTTPVEGDTLRLCVAAQAQEVCTEAPVRRRPPEADEP